MAVLLAATPAAEAAAPVPFPVVVPPSGISPNSASSCNAEVCIDITGSGTNVSDWTTSATGTGYICTYAGFLANGVVVATSSTVCGTNRTFQADWADPGYFPAGTELCNTWSGIAGRACEEITA